METPKKKSFWKVLGRVSGIGAGGFIGMLIADWIREGELSWSSFGTRLISMVIVVLIFGFIEYKVQK